MIRSDRIVYHNNGGQDDGSTNVNKHSTYPNSPTGLQLAKYVLIIDLGLEVSEINKWALSILKLIDKYHDNYIDNLDNPSR